MMVCVRYRDVILGPFVGLELVRRVLYELSYSAGVWTASCLIRLSIGAGNTSDGKASPLIGAMMYLQLKWCELLTRYTNARVRSELRIVQSESCSRVLQKQRNGCRFPIPKVMLPHTCHETSDTLTQGLDYVRYSTVTRIMLDWLLIVVDSFIVYHTPFYVHERRVEVSKRTTESTAQAF
jgi:hypothetical protein